MASISGTPSTEAVVGARPTLTLPDRRDCWAARLACSTWRKASCASRKNASPASVRAALNLLGTLPTAFGGRRIAVLGDMRELGNAAPELHRGLAPDLSAAQVERAFLVGPHMKGLYDLLPDAMKGAYRATSDEMVQPLIAALKAGDTVPIKGSLGTRMAPLVDAVRGLDRNASRTTGDGH